MKLTKEQRDILAKRYEAIDECAKYLFVAIHSSKIGRQRKLSKRKASRCINVFVNLFLEKKYDEMDAWTLRSRPYLESIMNYAKSDRLSLDEILETYERLN